MTPKILSETKYTTDYGTKGIIFGTEGIIVVEYHNHIYPVMYDIRKVTGSYWTTNAILALKGWNLTRFPKIPINDAINCLILRDKETLEKYNLEIIE